VPPNKLGGSELHFGAGRSRKGRVVKHLAKGTTVAMALAGGLDENRILQLDRHRAP